MSVFTLRPKDMPELVMSMGEDSAIDYQVLPSTINMNEDQRYSIVYSEAGGKGIAEISNDNLVDISFEVVILGTSQKDCLILFRNIVKAVTNPKGGYLEYRPVGLANNVMTTWYKYLVSFPPKIDNQSSVNQYFMEKFGQFGRLGGCYGLRTTITLKTRAWATNDPLTVNNIIGTKTLQNCDFGTDKTYFIIEDSDIKGDVFFPYIEMNSNIDQFGAGTTRVTAHCTPLPIDGTYQQDSFHADNTTVVGGLSDVSQPHTIASKAFKDAGSGAMEVSLNFGDAFNMTEFNFGNVTPLIIVNSPNSEWEIYVELLIEIGGSTTLIDKTDSVYIESIGPELYWHVLKFTTLRFPGIPELVGYDSTTTPTLAEVMTDNLILKITFTRISGTGRLSFNGGFFLESSDWIAEFTGHSNFDFSGTQRLTFSSVDSSYVRKQNDSVTGVPIKRGSPMRDFVLKKGTDWAIRLLSVGLDDIFQRDGIVQDVSYGGLFGTIYPFEEI